MKVSSIILAEVVPIAVLLAALKWAKWRRTAAGERLPQSEKLLREPGHTLCRQTHETQESFLSWFALSTLGGLLCGLFLTFEMPGRFGACLVGIATAALGTIMGWRALMRERVQRLGLFGERAVAEHLQALIATGYRIFHDVPANGLGNVDHVVVGRSGVFAIETKARTKKRGRYTNKDHEVSYDGKDLRFPWGIDADAPLQARRNAEWLGRELTKATGESIKAQPILVFPGWFVAIKARSDLAVLNPKQIATFVREGKDVLSEDSIQRIVYQLDQRCRDVEF